MATKTQIEEQLRRLGCKHTLQFLWSAAFILLHVNPAAFDRMEATSEARIADQRKQTARELVAGLNPRLWVDTAAIVCERFGDSIYAKADGSALRSFMDSFPPHVPKWVPVSIFLLLAIPKDAGPDGEALRKSAMESIKARALEEGIKRVPDSVRRAALSVYEGVDHSDIARAYIAVFKCVSQK